MMYFALRPLLFLLDPERAHDLTIGLLKRLPARQPETDPPSLGVDLFGLHFSNPVGLAAGFDKNAEVAAQMLGFGFGFVEVGTVTPRPQLGNPRPRLFRLVEDEAVINRMGFNNQGQGAAYIRVTRLSNRNRIIGVNIGANKDSGDRILDYRMGVEAFRDAASYYTINISSPNTPGLRDLQARETLRELIIACQEARQGKATPILVKIAPDLEKPELKDVAEVALDQGADGLIIANTTLHRPPNLVSSYANVSGGLSGKPLMVRSTAMLKYVYGITQGQLPLVGVGGISSAQDAYAKIRAGASLVQLYSALIYQGPGLVGRIKRGLVHYLERDGLASIADAVGLDAGRQ